MIVVGQNFALDAFETRGDGLAHVTYVLTQPGVYAYQMRDGRTVRALKAPSDWLGDAFLQSTRSVPVTIEHPAKLATPHTANDHVGLTDSTPAFVKDGKVFHGATLNRQDAIDLVRTKVMKGVSAGTHVTWQENSGVFVADDGTSHPYDVVQTGPLMNHTALTRAMRVKSATFVVDSDIAAIWVPDSDAMDELKELLAKLSLDSTAVAALTKLVSDRDAQLADLARTSEALRGELTGVKAQLASAPSLDSLGERVAQELSEVAQIAAKVPGLSLDALAKAKSVSERYIMALDSLKVKVDPKSGEDFLRGAFLGATAQPTAPAAPAPVIHPNSARAGIMAQDSAPKPLSAQERVNAARELNARRSRGEQV